MQCCPSYSPCGHDTGANTGANTSAKASAKANGIRGMRFDTSDLGTNETEVCACDSQ